MLRMYMNYGIDMRKVADRDLPDSSLSERWTGDRQETDLQKKSRTFWLQERQQAESTEPTD